MMDATDAAPVDTRPRATGRLEILSARRRARGAFFEAILREGLNRVVRRGDHPCCASMQPHPALGAKLIEAVHDLRLTLAIHGRGFAGRIGGGS